MSCTPSPPMVVVLSAVARLMIAGFLFIFYCCPLTTTATRRQGCPCTLPPPTRIILSAVARPMKALIFLLRRGGEVILIPRCSRRAYNSVPFLISFVLLSSLDDYCTDGNKEEVMSSSSPAYLCFYCYPMTMRRRRGHPHTPPPPMLVFFIDRGASNDSVPFFIFYCYPTRTTTRRRRGYPRTPPPPTCVVLSAAKRPMTACLFYYCCPLTTTTRQGCPCTPLHPTRVLVSALALPMTAFLFYFLLLPAEDNIDKEARLSSYPAAPDARL